LLRRVLCPPRSRALRRHRLRLRLQLRLRPVVPRQLRRPRRQQRQPLSHRLLSLRQRFRLRLPRLPTRRLRLRPTPGPFHKPIRVLDGSRSAMAR
jgi:hypothetical protein